MRLKEFGGLLKFIGSILTIVLPVFFVFWIIFGIVTGGAYYVMRIFLDEKPAGLLFLGAVILIISFSYLLKRFRR